ncbi:DUF4855 domain-containing protein [Bacteroides thetaiotaomicron]|nr:DUF4855 domain-containing protein [Bacteroides thetaiotaomicron]
MKRFKQAKYKHLKLSGFYWLAEDIDFTKDLSVPLSKYIHSMNKTFLLDSVLAGKRLQPMERIRL